MNGNQKVDRRRQHRVQGSWNKPAAPVWTNKNIDSEHCKNSRLSNKDIDSIKRMEPEDEQASGGFRGRRQHGYSFDHTVRSAAKKEMDEERGPQIEKIIKQGIYELSVDTRNQVPSTVRFQPTFLEREEADKLFDFLIVNLPWQQRTGLNREGREYKEPRLTCWFGEPYVYSHVTWQSNHDWPQELLKLRERLSDQTGVQYNSVMCNYYRNDKDSIGWHADDEPSLGKHPNIASISLGAVRNFELKRKEDHFSPGPNAGGPGRYYSVPLPHGSLLIMEGSVQDQWLHRVPKEYHDRPGRVNLTFRVIVNSPDHHMDVSEPTKKVISRSQEDNSPAVINYQQKQLNFRSLQESETYFLEGGWGRPNSKDGGPGSFQLCSFTSYDPWPEWLTNAGRDAIQNCSARSDRRITWSSAQCIFLQRGTEHVPWRYERGQNPVVLICLWGDRPIKLRRWKSSTAVGDLETLTVTRCTRGDIFVMEGNVQRHWMFSIPRDARATYSSCFLLLRAEEPFPADTQFQSRGNGSSHYNKSQLPRIHLETASDACGHADLCERCHQALSIGQTPDCPVCQAELRRSFDFTHP